MKGFGIITPRKQAGWIEKDAPEIGLFDALASPVVACTCTSDVHQVFRADMPKGMILGHEVVARIEKVGSMVTRFKPGDVVSCGAVNPNWRALEVEDGLSQHTDFPLGGMNWCITADGTFAEHFIIRDVDMNGCAVPDGCRRTS